MQRKTAVLFAGIFFLAMAGVAWAESATQHTVTTVQNPLFSSEERRIIEKFYYILGQPSPKTGQVDTEEKQDDDDDQGHGSGKKEKKGGKNKSGLPPGLAKKESLPPGLAKQLERNGTLPAGLAKRNLPSDLETQLPPTPQDLERVIVNRDIVLVDRATGVIRDILRGVVTSGGN